MPSSRNERRGLRRVVDRTADALDVLPQILAVAILGAAVAGYLASRSGDGDGVGPAAIGGFVVLFVVAVLVAVVRDRRRQGG